MTQYRVLASEGRQRYSVYTKTPKKYRKKTTPKMNRGLMDDSTVWGLREIELWRAEVDR
jgi:hypothetical protein